MAENYGTLEGTLDEHGVLSGEMSDRATLEGEIQFGSGGGGVLDVFQNGQSVVQGRYAYVTVPTLLRELRSDDYHNTVTTLEIQNWNGKADPDDIPTALSQLDNDDNYVQDADYVHTDNNFTDEDKAAIGNIPENITDLSDVAVDNIQNGQVLKWDATQEKFVNANESGGGGDITDVKVDGTSVVDPVTGEADIDLSGKADKALDAVAGDFAVLLANGNYANSGKSANDMASKAEMSVSTSGTQTTVQLKNGTSATINNPTITIQKNGQNVDTFTLNQTANKVIDISVPTKTSDLQNDSSFIDNTVNNLANYYLKTQTYTQAEVDALIDAAVNGRFQKVNVLPATGEPNIIYLVPKATPETSNACDEYIWQDNAWELIGSTDIDLSGYVTDDELNTALADYLTTSAFNTAIANYYTKTEVGNLLDDKVDKISGKGLSTNDYDNTAKGIVDTVTSNLANKVDKVSGKGLSTNDYSDTDKAIVSGVTSALAGKVDKETGKGLSTNDFTNEDKALIGQTLGNNTVLTTDKTPFLTRQTLNPTGFSGYVREKLIGASYAWNQQVEQLLDSGHGLHPNNFSSISVSNGLFSFSAGQYSRCGFVSQTLLAGHKYLVSMTARATSGSGIMFFHNLESGWDTGSSITLTSSFQTLTKIYTLSENRTVTNSDYPYRIQTLSSCVGEFKNVQFIDLTLAFGSTIADHLYSLTNNGGITKLRDMGCPIDKYTPYGYGLYSVKTSGKRVLSANLITGLYNGLRYSNGNTYSNATRVSTDGFISLTPNKYKIISKSNISGKTLRIAYHFWSNTTEGSNSQTYDSGWINLSETTELEITSNVIMDGTFSFTDNSSITPSDIEVKLVASVTTYSLGNDELRGKFDLVNGEIVASGDVKKSNGEIDRVYKVADLGDLNWTYDSSSARFYSSSLSDVGGELFYNNEFFKNVIFSSYNMAIDSSNNTGFIYKNKILYIYDNRYTDAATFKTAITGQKVQYELATLTTEQSTPFADPMSLVGATIEEYIDTRDIPCPVGAERQYMGQSEDVVEIPSNPQSDGKRVLTSYKSGDKEQLVWEDLGFAIASVVKSYNIGTTGARIKMSNGSIFMIGRNSAGVKGIYMVDSQGIPIPMITATGSFTVTANDGIVTIINNSGVAIRITIIEPYVI